MDANSLAEMLYPEPWEEEDEEDCERVIFQEGKILGRQTAAIEEPCSGEIPSSSRLKRLREWLFGKPPGETAKLMDDGESPEFTRRKGLLLRALPGLTSTDPMLLSLISRLAKRDVRNAEEVARWKPDEEGDAWFNEREVPGVLGL